MNGLDEASWMTVQDAPVYSAYIAHNAPVFKCILDLYVPLGSTVADVTYGRGTFWKNVPPGDYHVLASDIQTGTDCRQLPYADQSIDAVVLDPPYMEGLFRLAHQTVISHGDFRERYSQALPTNGGPKYHQAVLDLYLSAMREAVRVLRRRGLLIVKCQDEVSNHRQWLTHVELITAAAPMGLGIEDLFVVVRPDRPSVGRIKKQAHARKRHSYFLVFRQGLTAPTVGGVE